jgi:NAD(P)-dependent dehydrogenase (short-subunit alcohol dehydrogenase family)
MGTAASRRTSSLLAGLGVALAARGAVRRLRRADLRDQVAVVTGGSRGLGFLLARTLAEQGCRLVLNARDGAELERAGADLERGGAQVLRVPGDVGDKAQATRLIEQATTRFGGVDVLVNNAGVIQVGPLATMTAEDFKEALDVMLWGALHPTLAVLPQMLERRAGRIVNITSIGGKLSAPHLLPYSTAKFAAVGFSEGLRAELASSGVSVTTVVPGLMRTGSHLNAWFKGDAVNEFSWFSLGASLPLVSIDAERAARRIVEAARRGQAELVLTPQARLAASAHGLFPGTFTRTLSVVNRLLPAAEEADPSRDRGMELMAQAHPALRGATRLGVVAARRFHQFPGPVGLRQSQTATDGNLGTGQAGRTPERS